jgi:glyoxylase-like metal-dependent hydrolase (beta-lactamase superfamily II)
MPSEPSIRVGAFEVVPLLDGWAPLPLADELPGRTIDWSAERARFPWAFASADHWAWHVRCFLVRSDAAEILVDTGIGHLGRPPYAVDGRVEASIAEAGSSPAAISHVVHTHLHADHAGGACRPDGTPRFPNAVHHVHDADWRFFATSTDDDDFEGRTAMTSLDGMGQLSISSDDRTIVDGIRVLHTPGHTPGHRCAVLQSEDDGLLLTGDLLHHPIQIAHPEWASSHDEDEMLGVASRRILLFRARQRGWRVAVTHFARPFGRLGDNGWEPSA